MSNATMGRSPDPKRARREARAKTEWMFGVTDAPWKDKHELPWDEKLTAANIHTFHDVASNAVAEQAWTPRDPDNDPDNLERFRYSCISRHIFSFSPEHDDAYEQFKKVERVARSSIFSIL